MIKHMASMAWVVLFWAVVCGGIPSTAAASPADDNPAPVMFSRVSAGRATQSGLEATSGTLKLRITALRKDILRFQISRDGNFPPNHSWAVLPELISASAPVQPSSDASRIGFSTGQLNVRVSRADGAITISDASDHVLLQDYHSRPATFFQEGFKVYKSAFPDEHFYGLGDKSGSLDRRNHAYQLWATDAYGWEESTDPLYKSIPFFLSVRDDGTGFGLLLDNTYRSSFDFTTELRDGISFGAEGGDLDYYFIDGPRPKDVLTHYADLVGHAPLPPLWAFGFQQSRYSYESEKRAREIADTFRQKKIPLDVIYLDIDYQVKNRPFTIDAEQFPNFNQMVTDFKKEGIHLIAITDLHIAKVANAGYAPYDSGLAGDHFAHNPDGAVYTGEVWPGPSVFPEFTRAVTRKWWGSLYKNFYVDRGIDGFWNDMNEPSIFNTPTATMPLDVVHRIDEPGQPKRSTTHREIHNVLGMENSRATYEGLLALKPNVRPFVLTRSTYAGGQRYAATWTGDNAATWNQMRISTPQLLNLGLTGIPYVGDDIGGFRGSPTPDLLTRWIELGAFNPIYRDHTQKGTADQEPWVHGPEHEAIRKRYIELRYQLMPYIYTVAEEASRTGIPMMRPVFLEFPQQHTLSVAQANSEFFFGPALLVAPQPQEMVDAYEVALPGGKWYDYWTGQPVPDNAPVRIEPKLEQLSLFVRAGSILPQQAVVQSTSQVPSGPLQLKVYPGPQCSGTLYTDDGTTFEYRKGNYLRENFSCEVADGGLRVKIAPHEGNFQPWWKQIELQIAGESASPKQIKVNGAASDVPAQVHSGSLYLVVNDGANGTDIEIEK